MKSCPYCGKELPEELQFCPYCMKKLVEEQPVATVPVKKPFPLWVMIVGIVAVIAIVVGIVLATGGAGSSHNNGGVAGGTTTTNQTTTTTKQQIKLSDKMLSASDYHEEIKKLHPEIESYILVSEETGKNYTNTGSETNFSGACIIQENGNYIFSKKSGDRQYLVYYMNKERLVVTVPNNMGTLENAIADATAFLKDYPGGLTKQQLLEKFETEGETKVHQGTVTSTTTTDYTDTIHGVKYMVTEAPTFSRVTLEFTPSYLYTVTEDDRDESVADDATATTMETTTAAQTDESAADKPTTTKKGDTTAKKTTTTTTKKGTTTAKKGTATTTASNGGSAQNACANGHSWKEITKTVHHEEEGHYEWVVVKEEYKWYDCPACDKTFEKENADNLKDYYKHFDSAHASGLEKFLREEYTSGTVDEEQEERWIVDKKAYDETVITGYKCSVCGETK